MNEAENKSRGPEIFRRSNGRKKTFVPAIITACGNGVALLKKINLTAGDAAGGDVILFSSACSSCDQFRIQKIAQEVCLRAADSLADAIGSVSDAGHPYRQAVGKICRRTKSRFENLFLDLPRGFLRKNPGAKTNPTLPHTKGRPVRQTP